VTTDIDDGVGGETESLDPPIGIPRAPELAWVVERLRARAEVLDREFDAMLPAWARALSSQHWTPVSIARRAADMLKAVGGDRVLDVGAGVGKFCLVAALSGEGTFVGVEQRPHLVAIARAIARQYGIRGAQFIQADLADVDWRGYDAFYFYNPFGENYFGPQEWIDGTVVHSLARYERDKAVVLHRLAAAKVGARIVTFHGFGDDPPEGYERTAHEEAGSDALELWVKTT